MQAITFACSVLFVVLDLTQAQDDNGNSLYTRRYEHLDIDTILASPRLVTNYVECLLNKKPCAPEGKALKRILPEALRTKCSRCWPSQKEGALKVITSLYYKYPDYYNALREKWDPTGEYNRRFEEYLRDQKFNSIGGNSDTEPGEQAQGSSVSINITQRPTRQDDASTSDKDLPEISNRFGTDGNGYDYENPKPTTLPAPETTQRPKVTQRPAQPQQMTPPRRTVIIQSQAINQVRCDMSSHLSNGGSSASSGSVPSSSGSGNAPSHTWNQNNSPAGGHTTTTTTTTTYYLKTQNPVLNIINRITMKFANTAEFIAGMLRGAVPQQKAKKRKEVPVRSTICDRLRKTLYSYKNTRTVNSHHHRL